ncbi:MAG: macro domain-containing protein [Deferribacterota bacterium]|nr:macro domain-containing protein [Deferribacterota bacterium]
MEKIINGVKLKCVQGDIANQRDVEAVANAANAWLKPGGGVAGAIHRAAGPELEKECEPLAPIKPGEAVITSGCNLPNKYVIHCLGPVYGEDKPEDKLLADCYKNALKIVEDYKISSIAFPAISTGAFGYPIKEAVEVTFDTILKIIPQLNYVKEIRFVLYTNKDYEIYKNKLSQL